MNQQKPPNSKEKSQSKFEIQNKAAAKAVLLRLQQRIIMTYEDSEISEVSYVEKVSIEIQAD